MSGLEHIIAHAIKKADKSYVFEDYSKQARAVLNALAKEGMVIAPLNPTEPMIAAGEESIMTGQVKPADHVRWVYQGMLAARNGKK